MSLPRESWMENLAGAKIFCAVCGDSLTKGKRPHVIIDQYSSRTFRMRCTKKEKDYTVYVG